MILPRKVVLPIPPKDSSSAFRGLHPQPTPQENRLLSYPEAVRTLVRTKGPVGCWLPSSRPSSCPCGPGTLCFQPTLQSKEKGQ